MHTPQVPTPRVTELRRRLLRVAFSRHYADNCAALRRAFRERGQITEKRAA